MCAWREHMGALRDQPIACHAHPRETGRSSRFDEDEDLVRRSPELRHNVGQFRIGDLRQNKAGGDEIGFRRPHVRQQIMRNEFRERQRRMITPGRQSLCQCQECKIAVDHRDLFKFRPDLGGRPTRRAGPCPDIEKRIRHEVRRGLVRGCKHCGRHRVGRR